MAWRSPAGRGRQSPQGCRTGSHAPAGTSDLPRFGLETRTVPFTPRQERAGIQYRSPQLHTAGSNFILYSDLFPVSQHCLQTYSLNSGHCGSCNVVVGGSGN